jgi:hypothetical protein
MAANSQQAAHFTKQAMIDDLRELITALKRRVPQFERTDEIDIARDAGALIDKALKRIAELEASRE